MTNTTMTNMTHSNPDPSTSTFTDGDPRPLFAKAVDLGGQVIAGVRPDQLHDPTPCSQYDVETLLAHLVGVLRRVAALGRGEDALALAPFVHGVAADGWTEAWAAAAHDVQQAWSSSATLARTVRVPWGETSGGAALGVYVGEVTTHTWDLATATGQHPAWDDDVVRAALAATRQALPAENRTQRFREAIEKMPPERRPSGFPFAEAVEVPADAPLIHQLVAWNGRRP